MKSVPIPEELRQLGVVSGFSCCRDTKTAERLIARATEKFIQLDIAKKHSPARKPS